jgi:hypothetical protein
VPLHGAGNYREHSARCAAFAVPYIDPLAVAVPGPRLNRTDLMLHSPCLVRR